MKQRIEGVGRRTGFDCEYLLNAKCEFFQDSQSIETQEINFGACMQ